MTRYNLLAHLVLGLLQDLIWVSCVSCLFISLLLLLLLALSLSPSVPVLLFFTFLHLLIFPSQSLARSSHRLLFVISLPLFSHFLSDLISCLLYVSPPPPYLFFTFLSADFHHIFSSSAFVLCPLLVTCLLTPLLFIFLLSLFCPLFCSFFSSLSFFMLSSFHSFSLFSLLHLLWFSPSS